MSSHSTGDAAGASAATLPTYTIGFVLAIVLTAIPFGLVAFGWLAPGATLIWIAATAIVQILVHLYFFLHLDVSRDHLANTMTGLFTVVIMAVLVGGTIWLFYSLDYRTMPMMSAVSGG